MIVSVCCGSWRLSAGAVSLRRSAFALLATGCHIWRRNVRQPGTCTVEWQVNFFFLLRNVNVERGLVFIPQSPDGASPIADLISANWRSINNRPLPLLDRLNTEYHKSGVP